MQYKLWAALAAVTFTAVSAHAQEQAQPQSSPVPLPQSVQRPAEMPLMGVGGAAMHAKTRQEAIENTKKRLADLEKMTDAEWETMRQQRVDRIGKLRSMPPEEREKLRQQMLEKRKAAAGAAAPAATTPPAVKP